MKKSMKIILFSLAVCLYVFGLLCLQKAEPQAKTIHILLREPISAGRAENIVREEASQEEGAVLFCFWNQGNQESVFCRETGKQETARVVTVCGNTELLGGRILNFQKGCLIDPNTARELFGTAQCGGQNLSQGEKTYLVFGTVETMEPTILRSVELQDTFNRIVLVGTRQEAENFLIKWGLQGEILNFFPFWALTADFGLLLPAVLLAALCVFFGGKRSRFPSRWRRIRVLLVAAIGLVMMAKFFVIPEELIPTRWSDFSFWSRWWRNQKNNFLTIVFTPLGNEQLQMIFSMIKSIVCSILSALVAAVALMIKDIDRRQDHADLAD